MRRASFLLGLGSLVLLVACGDESTPVSEEISAPLSVFEVTLAQDEYMRVGVEQDGTDRVLNLIGPTGDGLVQVDTLAGSEGREEVHWVAATAGTYRVEMTPGETSAPHGGIRLELQRPATEEDRHRTAAEKALADGHGLRRVAVVNATCSDAQACEAAVEGYRDADRLFAELALPERRAETLFALGLVRRGQGANELAHQVFVQSSELFGDALAKSDALQQAAEVAVEMLDWKSATDHYERALELRELSGDRTGKAITANNLGHLYHLLGRWDDARPLLERAEILWRDVGDDGWRANTLHNLGRLARDQGETGPALQHLLAALDLARQAGNPKREAEAESALGALLLDLERLEEARERLETALTLHPEGSQGRVVTLVDLGVVYRRLAQPEEARRVYEQALDLARHRGDTREEAKLLHNLALLEWRSGNEGLALDLCRRALALFDNVFDPAGRANTLRLRARVRRGSGDLLGAREDGLAALEEIEDLRLRQRRSGTRSVYFSTRQDFYDFLIELLMELDDREPRTGWVAEALEVAERARARSLLDSLAIGEDPRRGAGLELLEEERELEDNIAELLEWRERFRVDPEVKAGTFQNREEEVLEQVHGWQERLQEVRAEIRATNPRWASLGQPETLSTAEILAEMEEGTLLLEYRLGLHDSFGWAVGPEGVQGFKLVADRGEIESLVRDLHRLLSKSWAPHMLVSARQRLARLGQILLEPVEDLLHDRRLVIVADGALQYLPFAALPLPGNGEPVMNRHEVVALPSLSALAAVRQRLGDRPPAPGTLWMLADPDFDGWYVQLPHTREEASALEEAVPGGDVIRWMGARASRQAVLAGGLGRYRFVHFATHGFFDAAAPEDSRLVLAQVDEEGRVTDGMLRVADVYRLQLSADLVVLSACGTALGKEVRGEGLVGMTQGFLHAGAERVVVSLWNVPDRPTAELMKHFYRGMLREGHTPAAALRAAQQAIRSRAGWEAPYYWAGFVLQGEWRGMRFPVGSASR